MPGIEIRRVPYREFVELGVNHYAFGATPSPRDVEKARGNEKYATHASSYAVFDNGTAMATCNVHAMTQNVRGAIIPMAGIGGVASMPQGRRQGHVRNMLVQVFAEMKEGGIPVSTLYPFRDSFYERLGYAEFPKLRYATIDPGHLSPLVRAASTIEVEQREIGEAFDEAWAYLEVVQADRHGFAMSDRDRGSYWRDENDEWIAFVREQGAITGMMAFKITGYTREMQANTLHTSTMAARYALLGWIGRHEDQVKEVVIELAPDDYPELWYRDLTVKSATESSTSWPGAMARVIDITGLTGIGTGEASVCLTIVDDQCPWNNGDWTLRGEGGVLKVTRGGTPDGHLTIQGLSACVWTGMDPASFAWRGWGDPGIEAQAALRTLFPPAVPILNEKF